MAYLPPKLIEQRLLRFLEEDLELGDVTAELVPNKKVQASLLAKEAGILCGARFAQILMGTVGITVLDTLKDGDPVELGDIILRLEGMSRDILIVERTILNLIMRLSGIATITHKLVNKVRQSGLTTRIASTRKTTPGFRYFEKYAVRVGGGDPHRWGLSDAILIKKNHLALFDNAAIRTVLNRGKIQASFSKKIEIEVEDLAGLKQALAIGADIVMLDNFSPETIITAIQLLDQLSPPSRPLVEVSGGITEVNIGRFLIPGVDILSVGFLTHSVCALDFSLVIKNR